MATTYIYSKSVQPDLAQIHVDVAASAMTDKAIEYCLWDEDDAGTELKVILTNALSGGDKTILDGIVA